MRDTLNEYLEKFKENSKKHKKMISVFFMLALIVAVGVTWRLKLIGVSMTNEVYCGKEEHIHTADCYQIVEASRVTDDDVIVATSTQTDAISDDGAGSDEVIPEGYVKILVCGKEEHIHTMACMSDETADLETEEYWRDLINVLNLRGESYSEDLLAIADSQIGYSESIRNFEVLDNENSKNGITRYGQWYGNPYGNWNAMFVAFCLNYAGVSSNIIPYNSGVEAWMVDLTKKDLYQNSSVYTPTAGDIAFVDSDGDGTADEVGIVREITYDENDGVTINGISLIQGDVANGFDVNEFDTNESVAADILNEDAKEEKTDCVQIVWYLKEAENDVTSDDRVEGDEASENETGEKQLSGIIGYVGIPVKESIEASEEVRDDIVDVDNENIQELRYSSSRVKLYNASSVAGGYKRIYFDVSNTDWFLDQSGWPRIDIDGEQVWYPMIQMSNDTNLFYYDVPESYNTIQFSRATTSSPVPIGTTAIYSKDTIGTKRCFVAAKWGSGLSANTDDQIQGSGSSGTNTWLNVTERTFYLNTNNVASVFTNPVVVVKDSGTKELRYKMSSIGTNMYSVTIDLREDYTRIWFTNSESKGVWNPQSADESGGIRINQITSKDYFVFDGSYSDSKYNGSWQDLATNGSTIRFVDLTGGLSGVTVELSTKSDFSSDVHSEWLPITGGVANYTVGSPASGKYAYVRFKNNSQILNSDANDKYLLMNVVKNELTYYYGATEKSNGDKISYWGGTVSAGTVASGKKLYLNKLDIPVKSSGQTVKLKIGSGTETKLEPDTSDATIYSYTLNDSISTTDKITVTVTDAGTSSTTSYHFYWGDTAKNLVTVNKAIAAVTDTYTASQYSVFYDATYSKLSYLGTTYKVPNEDTEKKIYENTSTDKSNYIIPWENKDIYFHAWNSDTDQQDGTCRLLNQHTSDDGNNVWKDIYVADLNKQYTNIIFYTSDAQGTWPDGSNEKTTSRTGDLTIPWNTISNPCFYADTSDNMIYKMYTTGLDGRNTNTCRSGFWDEVYTVRDAEKGKATDIVPIDANSSFSAAANVRYVNSTFYDYYSDFELNGNKRADYGESNGFSHKNWVTFRQFDQALSDYYRDAGTVSSPIYTGHFQPDYSNWTEKFSEIAGTLDLYGWSDRNKFLANNNSTLDINGGYGKYSCAAQGLVENSLGNDNKLKNTGGAIEPHFDKEFLEGSNSKNAVIGEVFENVAFPFTEVEAFKDEPGVKYWWFDSASTTVQLKKNRSYATDSSGFEYFLDGSAGSKQNWALNVNSSGTNNGVDSVSNIYGFFPFNNMSGNENGNCGSKYNYGFGTKLEFTFSLGKNGMIQSTDGKSYPSRMRFSGDDDVWIFIDGKLALDCGGAHGKVSGMLDFSTLTGYVTDVKNNNEEMYSKLSTPVSVTYTKGGKYGSTEVADLYNYSKTFSIDGDYMDAHTVTIFFMERGMWESNFSLIFASTPPVYTLPETGGSGTNMLIYSGIAILLLGCLYYRYVFRQFKEERRKV